MTRDELVMYDMADNPDRLLSWGYFARRVAEFDDPYVRRIVILRCYCGYSWAKVAAFLGGTTPDSCRMIFNRAVEADSARLGKF